MKIWDCFVINVVVLEIMKTRVESWSFHRVMEEEEKIVVEKENFRLIPSPNLLALPEVEDDSENTTQPMYGLACSVFFFFLNYGTY